MIEINTSDIKQMSLSLRAGDEVLLSGTVYTARDAAHKRISEMIDKKEPLPFDLVGAVIYYAGPTPAPEGMVIGSVGPTTSGRMDLWTPRLLDLGLGAMVGKGQRSPAVTEAIVRNKAVYFIAIGGTGALCAKHITSAEVIAFEDLGCEAVRKLTFKKFPVYVANDCHGGSLFYEQN
ncbi:MAG: FumA C-terminus/TtdB family hydratase beta subunit [Eubacteriales bacterium]|nr:FumA C-terminus/TtdB family hydratase beta subunit [Eubacteriales bacterium]MDD4475008.1 FumA C-terminus/TtdB family hydratase beta subunit [Eubacteriales bacterium]